MATLEQIIKETKRLEEDSIYSAKGHFYAGQCWSSVHLWLGGIATVFSAIAGVSAVSQFTNHSILSGVISLVIAVLTGIFTFINPNERSATHQNAGNAYTSLKNDARVFYDIESSELSLRDAIAKIKKLNERRNKLNSQSPLIPTWAFKKARKGIEDGEAEYKVDKQGNKKIVKHDT